MLGEIWRRICAAFRRERLNRDLDEELRGHFDDLCRGFEDDGYRPEEARRLARLRLGGHLQTRESSQDEWRLGWLEGIGQDVRLAWRNLRHRPGFAASAIATLALGIGVSTAIFSVAYGVALRPLPYADPERLVRLYESKPDAGLLEQDVSWGAFDDWRRATSIESVALFGKPLVATIARTEGLRVSRLNVSPSFFRVLGVAPALGPGFKDEAAYTRFTAADMVLSHVGWQRLFNGAPDVIGRTVSLAGDSLFTVVGVLPEHFTFADPVDMYTLQIVEADMARVRQWRYDRAVARLAPGASIHGAREELTATAARAAERLPRSNAGWTVAVHSLHESIVGRFARATWLLLAAAIIVLLVACVNVGSLLVARAVARAQETAVRTALGAGAWRLLRLALAEAALICVMGAGGGLAIAWLGVAALRVAAPPHVPRLEAIQLDWPVLAVAALATALAATVFSLAPIVGAPRRQLIEGLRQGTAGSGNSRGRQVARLALTTIQCAGAAALVVLAVMLSRSFVKLMAVDLGWQPEGVVALQVSPTIPTGLRRPWFALVEWSDRVVTGLESTPGIQRAAITTQLPLGPDPYWSALARGRAGTDQDDARWQTLRHNVSDGYFDVMQMAVLQGRRFDETDRFTEHALIDSSARPEYGVAIVTAQTARTLWPGESPIGRALRLTDYDNVQWREVIGVVEDMQFHAVGEAPGLHVFVPWTQDSATRIHVLVSTLRGADTVGPTARHVITSEAPGAFVDRIVPLDSLVHDATAQPRFTSQLVTGFGVLALVLAGVGMYGTLAYLVTAGTREIGIRLALGASSRQVWSQVIRRGLVSTVAGGAIGMTSAYLVARAFGALLFQVEPVDPVSFAGSAGVLIVTAFLAAWGPARRAARVDPAVTLRQG